MTRAKTPTSFSYSGIIILFICILILGSSCQKKTIPIPTKPDPTNPTTPTDPTGSNIVYTNVDPDSIILRSTTDSFNLDLNNDGITDFAFADAFLYTQCGDLGAGAGIKLFVTPANIDNAVMNDKTNFTLALDSGAVIDPDSTWANSLQILVEGTTNGRCDPFVSGNWLRASDKYLGLKFTKNNNSYYGWARFTCSYYRYPGSLAQLVKGILTLQDYAYNSLPGQPIFAGQTK
ncbi:MAG TPA: hypothetical protein VHZ50_17735 [Puia sp.]|nr:hypothetical protein [Puia sp.]